LVTTSTTTTAHVTYRRDPEDPTLWLVADDDEPRAHSYGRTLDEARANAREAVAVWRGVDVSAVELVERVEGD